MVSYAYRRFWKHLRNRQILSQSDGGIFICLPYFSGFLSRLSHIPRMIRFLLTVKAASLIFISGRGSAISSAKEGKSGFIYNLVKS